MQRLCSEAGLFSERRTIRAANSRLSSANSRTAGGSFTITPAKLTAMTSARRFLHLIPAILWTIFVALLMWRLAGLGAKYISGEFPRNFGDSLLSNQIWFAAHMIGGSIVLLLGPLQFIPAIRDRFRRYHRTAGTIYILASLVSIAALFLNILPSSECVPCRPSNYVVTTLWLLSIIAAWLSIRAHDLAVHRAFMMRGFVFAAYFLLVRTYGDAMIPYLPGEANDAGQWANSDWLTWILPLLMLEIYLFSEHYLAVRRAAR